MESTGTLGRIQSIERAIAVLDCFRTQPDLGVTEISERLKLNKSTAFGIIRTLAAHQFLQQCEDTGKYRLGVALLQLGNLVNIDLRRLCQPYIAELSEKLGETINLVVQREGNVVYIEKKESPYSVRICTQIGQELPMFCTATGKAILAYLPQREREEVLSSMRFHAYTSNTVRSREELEAALAKSREQGYALDEEELEYGLICLAVPVFNSERIPVAALSCSGPKQRMDLQKQQYAAELLFQAARQVEKFLP